MDVDHFIPANADPIGLHQNGLWEYIDTTEVSARAAPDHES
jgi:hypothetical protein